jgi:hypothetical protein
MKEDIELWIERLEEAARQYYRDDFCDKNPANIEAYDQCMESIGFLDALLKGPVMMGGAD